MSHPVTLIINAQDIKFMFLGLLKDGGLVSSKQLDAQPDDHLRKISDFLAEQNLSKEDIELIMVIRGPGSFTASRTSVTIANTMAFALNIPIIGIDNPEKYTLEELLERDMLKGETEKYITPLYDKAPHITCPKSS